MKLFTEVDIPIYSTKLDHRNEILMMGSCFTENIGQMMERTLFPVCINPFGVTYNPLSVKKGLDSLLHKEQYVEDDLDQNNGLWFSFDHYTGFSSPDRDQILLDINREFSRARIILKNASHLIITWGTAWVYRYNSTGEVVCNCHKIPASEFTRTRLNTEQIVETYSSLLPELFHVNPHLKIILTVSPVRHWKDGAHGNQLSKSTLLLACDQLVTHFTKQVIYFPSYEILMDELRDYRFYGDDLLHPSEKATSYIWEKFESSLISDESRRIIADLEPLLKMTEHRPFLKEGNAYRQMIQKQKGKLNNLKKKYPFLLFDKLEVK